MASPWDYLASVNQKNYSEEPSSSWDALASFMQSTAPNASVDTSAVAPVLPNSPLPQFDYSAPKALSSVGTIGGDSGQQNYMALLRELQSKQRAQIGKQDASLAELKKYYDTMPEAQSQDNLAPLMALADSWNNSGGAFTRGYTQPKSTEDLQAARANVAAKLADVQGKIGSNELDFLKTRVAAEKPSDAKEAKEPTVDQRKAATFTRRLQQAESVLSDLGNKGFDRTDTAEALKNKILPEAYMSDEYKQQGQAERNFLLAVLRRESGAAISTGELEEGALQYFPRAGDSPEVVQQKALNRNQVLQGLAAEAGRALSDVPQVPGVGSPMSTLQPGMEKNGYVYQGGNPNDPKSWSQK